MILLIYLLAILSAARVENDPNVQSKKELLTASSQQAWYVHSLTPDQRCGSAVDDTWVFMSDGTFEYNHGEVTNNETKQCSDFVNIAGKWELLDNETVLKVIAVEEKGNPDNTLSITLLEGKIVELDNEKLVVNGTDPLANTQYTFEFRKKQ